VRTGSSNRDSGQQGGETTTGHSRGGGWKASGGQSPPKKIFRGWRKKKKSGGRVREATCAEKKLTTGTLGVEKEGQHKKTSKDGMGSVLNIRSQLGLKAIERKNYREWWGDRERKGQGM